MPPTSMLTKHPPYAVEAAIKTLGAHLRTARLRRNLTIADMAEKLGTTRYVVSDAEGGKITTSVAVYVGLLWACDLLPQLEAMASPTADAEGLAMAALRDREKARTRKGPDNDF